MASSLIGEEVEDLDHAAKLEVAVQTVLHKQRKVRLNSTIQTEGRYCVNSNTSRERYSQTVPYEQTKVLCQQYHKQRRLRLIPWIVCAPPLPNPSPTHGAAPDGALHASTCMEGTEVVPRNE